MIFSTALVIRALAVRRPDKLYTIAIVVGIGIAAVAIGWMFAARRER